MGKPTTALALLALAIAPAAYWLSSISGLSFGPPVNPEDRGKCHPIIPFIVEECWERVYYVGVENLTSVLPADYFREFNGKLYMKVPALILYNNYSYSKPESAVVGTSINLERTESKVGVYATFALLGVTVWKSGDPIWRGERYSGYLGLAAAPNEWVWGYFWGRPAMAIYDHYYKIFNKKIDWDSNDYAVYAVTDFYIVNNIINKIQVDIARGKPDDALMDMLFQGSTARYVATLEPGDSIPFGIIFRTLDTCEARIPVGPIIALSLGNPLVAALAGVIGVSISVRDGFYIGGGVANNGAMGIGHNVTEDIYIRVSKYKFVQGSCSYDVPIGIYIDSR